ncbi:hypothetical protein BY458DRAFT_532398 [Sporodiniella umbellata]|nr:hypothetical protein BY458DRAFT_532398 [Sporodiniella umbellata]
MTEPVSNSINRNSKRKSLLSGLGIQPVIEPAKQTRRDSITTTHLKRSSLNEKTPSARATKTPTQRTSIVPTRKTPPPPPASKNGSLAPTPPTARRKSMVPSTLSRRSSVQQTVASKRMSTPVGLAEFNTESLEKDKRLHQRIEELEKLKLDVKNQDVEKEMVQLRLDHDQSIRQLKIESVQETEQALKGREEHLNSKHQQELGALEQENDKKLASELSTLRSECENMMNGLVLKNQEVAQQMEKIKAEHQTETKAREDLKQESDRNYESKIQALELELAASKEKIALFEKSETTNYIRKIENNLAQTISALERYKETAKQQLEATEQRHRSEIRQLQSGTDDTAMAWLEKTKLTQQEVDTLRDEIRQKDLMFKKLLETLKEQHEQELEEHKSMCDEKETAIEERSAQIEILLERIETLQSSLEAATVRLEHTAKSTPSSSSDRDEINQKQTYNGHEACIKRYEIKQKELFELKARLSESKEIYDHQLNKLRKEKVSEVQELQRAIVLLEQQKPMTPPPSINEDSLANLAEQHKKEMRLIHTQYQLEIDNKNQELDNCLYRVKTMAASKQKEHETMENQKKEKTLEYEKEVEGYEIKIRKLLQTIKNYQEKAMYWEKIHINTNILLENTKNGYLAYGDDKDQMLRLVNQLQTELQRQNALSV